MTEDQARDEICRIGRSLFDRGYVHGTAGNISVRQEDGFLITPTDACLGFLDPARLARLDAEGRLVSGDRPSKTIALHRRIYQAVSRADPRTACIVHSHSSHAVALSLGAVEAELLPPLTAYFVMKVGHVPLISYDLPGSPTTADRVEATIVRYEQLGTPLRAVMLQRLGPVVWHETPTAAMATLEELEETAKLCLLDRAHAAPLDETSIDALRQAFSARW
jgi:ribulose-5-phosphate 4-epimerase/fuculose-1-phosphate aldolase